MAIKRNPVRRQQRETQRQIAVNTRTAAEAANPTADAQSVNTVGHNRTTGCDTSGDFYTCGILGFTPLGDFILCGE